jgi:rare lipoprotein A
MPIRFAHRKGAASLLALAAAAILPGPVQGEVALAQIVVQSAPIEQVEAIPAVIPAPAIAVEAEDQGDVREELEMLGRGMASYYGAELAGNRTASGERFNPNDLTAAHRTLPMGTKVRVTNQANGRSVVVRINDRGPFAKQRIIDVSRAAAEKISMVRSGTARVTIERMS